MFEIWWNLALLGLCVATSIASSTREHGSQLVTTRGSVKDSEAESKRLIDSRLGLDSGESNDYTHIPKFCPFLLGTSLRVGYSEI